MGGDWQRFQEKYQEYITQDTLLIERTFDDPAITDTENCLYDICMSVPEDCTLANTTIISGGKFAVYHFNGPATAIYAAYQSIFNVWFPASGYMIDERYGYDIYREVDCEHGIFTMDICFPIK